jgi:hypothetical protein
MYRIEELIVVSFALEACLVEVWPEELVHERELRETLAVEAFEVQ